MIKRKQYLIDKEFQLRNTFWFIGIVSVILVMIVGIIGISATINNNRLSAINDKNDMMVENMEKVMQVQDDILETLMTWIQNPATMPGKPVIRKIAQSHYNNLNSIKADITAVKKNIADNNKIIKNDQLLLIFLVFLVLIQGAIMFFVLIRKTHKISGPLYVISGYMKDIIKGTIPNTRKLRENDDLQEFYELFVEMVDVLKQRESGLKE